MAHEIEPDAQAAPSPGRDAAFLFFFTAPAMLACAGLTLLYYGERALLDSWSPITMGLTHFVTLGFVSMTGIGAFYRLAPRQLDRPPFALSGAVFAHVGFTIGVVALCVGLAGVAVTPVFVAIGALFPALAVFFWPAIARLRGTRSPHPRASWRLAIGAFLAVTVLGIWVAHGHGGMDFPGPRSLWIQLHLSIALFGWVGALAIACLAARLERANRAPGDLPAGWFRLGFAGIVLPLIVLSLDYASALRVEASTARLIALAVAAPVAFASAILAPRWAFSALARSGMPRDETRLWRVAFAFGPITLAAAAFALWRDDASSRVVFGWVAVFGWAGLVAHAVLRSLAAPRVAVRVTLALHGLTLVAGVWATLQASAALTQIAGALVIALAASLVPRGTNASTPSTP